MMSSNRPRPKLRRLKGGKVMRNHRIVDYTELNAADVEQLELQELATPAAEEQLDPDQIVAELMRIDGKYAAIEMDLEKARGGLVSSKAQVMILTMKVLDRRRTLLRAMLDKMMPDRKQMDLSGALGLNASSAEGLSDEVLLAAIAGQLNDKQMEALKLLFEPGVGGEH